MHQGRGRRLVRGPPGAGAARALRRLVCLSCGGARAHVAGSVRGSLLWWQGCGGAWAHDGLWLMTIYGGEGVLLVVRADMRNLV